MNSGFAFIMLSWDIVISGSILESLCFVSQNNRNSEHVQIETTTTTLDTTDTQAHKSVGIFKTWPKTPLNSFMGFDMHKINCLV